MGEIYYDEVYEDSGEPRPHYRAAMEALGAVDLAALGERLRALDAVLPDSYGPRRIVEAVPGGLTRVALGEDSKVVNVAHGGGVRATWAVEA